MEGRKGRGRMEGRKCRGRMEGGSVEGGWRESGGGGREDRVKHTCTTVPCQLHVGTFVHVRYNN